MLTNLSNTVPYISTLIKKSDYDTEITAIKNKYVSNAGFDSKFAEANVITKKTFMQKLLSLKIILKNCKHSIRAILEVKVILKEMAYNIFSISTSKQIF